MFNSFFYTIILRKSFFALMII